MFISSDVRGTKTGESKIIACSCKIEQVGLLGGSQNLDLKLFHKLWVNITMAHRALFKLSKSLKPYIDC